MTGRKGHVIKSEARAVGRSRALARLLAAGVLAVVGLALAADRGGAASPAVKAKIRGTTLSVTGSPANDQIALRLRAGAPGTLEVDVGDDGSADFAFARSRFDEIVVEAEDGKDSVRIDEANGVFTDAEKTTLNGEADSDMLLGGSGAETLEGGAGDDWLRGSEGADALLGGDDGDFILGGDGDDLAVMGAGNDVFQWNPGDDNDTLEGQDGTDTMVFNGANVGENVDVSANGGRVIFFRNVASATMDMNDVESIDFRAFGGADNVVVRDLSGTDMTTIGLHLGGLNGGGDGQPDTITVNGTEGDDRFGAAGDAGGINVFGLQAAVNIFHPEQANDRLTLNAVSGDDVLDATSLEDDGIQLTMNGGVGADVFLGSEGDDLINGADGNDLALMGAGDDAFVWNPGDDNDTLEGQDGFDRMLFNGANVAENVGVSANGGRVIFLRNVAAVTIDLNDVEAVDFNAFGGADTVVVNDLSGTDVTEVNANLAAVGGGGDAQPDVVIVTGTNGDDVALAAGDASGVSVLGLAAVVNITGAEAANDTLRINALAGPDVVEASSLAANAIKLVAFGGDDDDQLIGGDGDDELHGGEGDDVLLGGPGIDVLDGGPGDDVEIQG